MNIRRMHTILGLLAPFVASATNLPESAERSSKRKRSTSETAQALQSSGLKSKARKVRR